MQSNSVNGQPDIANITVVTDERQVIVPQAITSVVEVNNPGPQGPVGPTGPQGPSVPFTNIGNDVYATTSSLQVTGSFLVSGSSTFTNIGPAVFSGSVNATSGVTMSSALVSGNVTVLGTASINVLQINTTINSTGSNQLGDNANDTQTLYGSVVIPTGSLVVTGSTIISSSAATQLQVGSNLLFVSSSGNVGIGTNTPFSPLTVNGVISSGNNLGASGGSTVQGELRSYQQNASPLYLSLQTSGNKSGLFRSNANYIVYYDTGNGDTVLNSGFSNANLRFTYLDSEKMRIFGPTGNVVIQNGGTFTDAGYRLDVNGSVRTTGSISAASAVARGTYLNQTLVATANNDVLVGLDIAPTFTTGAFTGVTQIGLRVQGGANITGNSTINQSGSSPGLTITQGTNPQIRVLDGTVHTKIQSNNTVGLGLFGMESNHPLAFYTNNIRNAQIFTTGNIVIQNGGTFTDNNYRLQVNATGSTNSGSLFLGGTTIATGSIARTMLISSSLSASANNDVLVGLDINPSFDVGSFTGVERTAIRFGTIKIGLTPAGQDRIDFGNQVNISRNNGEAILTATTTQTFLSSRSSAAYVAFALNQGITEVGRFAATTGNFLINTTTDAGFKLDVNGTARLSDTLSFTNNSSLSPQGTTAADRRLLIRGGEGGAVGSTSLITLTTNGNITSTSGNPVLVNISRDFAPTSGTATYTLASITGTINQTGGANGITRGLYINPTLTSAADFRAIDSTNGRIVISDTATVTGSNSSSLLDLSQTWNTSGTPTAIKLNITDTTSNGNSRLLDIQVGGASKFIFAKNGNLFFGAFNNSSNIQGDDATRGLILRTSMTTTAGSGFLFSNLQGNIANLSGTANGLTIQPAGSLGFNPTSGTGLYNSIHINDIINQTGGASGITRGLYVNPTLTSAANFRAIETTAGNVLFQSGSTPLMLVSSSGRVGIGTSTPAYALDVNGTIRSQGQLIVVGQIQNPTIGVVDVNGVLYSGTGVSIGVNSTNTARLLTRGSGATNATTTFLLQNSTPTNLLSVLDNGQVSFTTPTMSLAASQSAFSISPIISASNVVGGQYYGVNIAPTFYQTTGSQTETAFRVAATFTSSNATATSGSNIIADFGSTSAGSQLTVTDVTSGSIYMVNDVSGIPIIEATSNWDVNIYDFPNKVFEKTGSQVNIYGTMRVSGSFILPLSQSVAPQTGSAYWSGSLLFIYDGTRYRSSSFA